MNTEQDELENRSPEEQEYWARDYEDLEPRDEFMADEYCSDCGRPSHAIMNELCPMCYETTGGGGRID